MPSAPTAQAEHLLTKLVARRFPRARGQEDTGRQRSCRLFVRDLRCPGQSWSGHFGPLKKKAKEEIKVQDLKWAESLFWQLPDITKEAQEELGVNGGILSDFQPHDRKHPVNPMVRRAVANRQPGFQGDA